MKKKIVSGAVVAALALSVGFSGCGLVSILNEKDMQQTVAVVDIGKDANFEGELKDFVKYVEADVVTKRDLLSAFINVGDTYVNNYGMSYEQTFNTLMNELTETAVVSQYATAYVLQYKSGDAASGVTAEGFAAAEGEKAKLEYLLGGENSKGVNKAKYSLYQSINSALDTYEKKDEDKGGYKGTETRSAPTNVDTKKDEYLPLNDDKTLNYGVYTGYGTYILANAGSYEPVKNTNRNSRCKAYGEFIKNLEKNYLVTEEDKTVLDVLSLGYIGEQYISQLEQAVIEEFSDIYEAQRESVITTPDSDGIYTFVKDKYDGQDGLLGEQEKNYAKASAFETAMGGLSDSSFVLYAPATEGDTQRTYGYVYNILLPFSVTQNDALNTLKGYRDKKLMSESEYLKERDALMRGIKTTDQRAAWFNGETDYSFKAEDIEYFNGGSADRNYLFFENNLKKTDEYKALDKYAGTYSYNGKVTENKDGSYKLSPNVLDIDGMLKEFSAYINHVLGTTDAVELHAGDTMEGGATSADFEKYYADKQYEFADKKGKIDYSQLVYATGRVNFTDGAARETMFAADSERYKAMSAVNELQYAYTTDTGVLSQYIGYTVSAYDTSYIKEFEYAAQEAVKMGAGAFKVCAGDYGWHLIYVTETYSPDGGAVYNPVFNKKNVETEGTFENKFYEWIKGKTLAEEYNLKRKEIINAYSNDVTVVKYEKAYKDLLEVEQ